MAENAESKVDGLETAFTPREDLLIILDTLYLDKQSDYHTRKWEVSSVLATHQVPMQQKLSQVHHVIASPVERVGSGDVLAVNGRLIVGQSTPEPRLHSQGHFQHCY